METKVHQNTFNKGLDVDTSKSKYTNEHYVDAKNFRPLTEGGLSSGSMENVKGNKLKFYLPEGQQCVGYTELRDKLVLFAFDGLNSFIYSFIDDNNDSNVEYYSSTESKGLTLIYSDETLATNELLNLNPSLTNFDLRAVGRYETPTIQKVYWVDSVHPLRVCNIVANLTSYKKSDFNIIPNSTLASITFDSYTEGNLDVGVKSYAYQLYRANMQETPFSPCSELIPVTPTITNSSTNKLEGSAADINSGHGIIIKLGTISNLDTSFNRIRVVCIDYVDLNITPIIRIVTEQSFNSNTLTVIDTGQSLGTYTLEEFNTLGTANLIPTTIDTKNNYLFVGNITEDIFWNTDLDLWDSRAFRFPSEGNFMLLTNSGITNYYSKTNVPLNSDAINPSNLIEFDGNTDQQYRQYFKENGSTLGGEGVNISYSFNTRTFPMDRLSDGTATNNDKANYRAFNISGNLDVYSGRVRGFQRDEIYRFGIVFFDAKGRQSYTKWIGDIRMPTMQQYPITDIDGTTLRGIILYPVFTVNNLPAEVKSYAIVYVKRGNNDKTVVAQGFAYGVEENTSIYHPIRVFNTLAPSYNTTLDKLSLNTLIDFSSPEVNFNTINVNPSDYIDLIAKLNKDNYTVINITDTGTNLTQQRSKYQTIIDITKDRKTILKLQKLSQGNTTSLDGKAYTHTSTSGQPRGTSILLAIDSVYNYTSDYNTGLFNLRRNIIGYSGNTYTSRFNQEYVLGGYARPITDNTFACNLGDTFVCMYEYLRNIGLEPNTFGSLYQLWVMFPCETSINLFLRHDIIPTHSLSSDNLTPSEELFKAYKYTDYLWLNEDKLYKYNNTFNRQSDIVTYPAVPFDFSNQTKFDVRVYASDKKFNGEYSDSWLKFRAANKLDLDSTYGSLVRIIHDFAGRLLFFQEGGFGLLSVEYRSLLTDGNNSQLALGTGKVLERFDYQSTNYGITKQNHLILSNDAAYFYDSTNNKVIRTSLQEVEGEISMIHGLNSLFRKDLDSTYNIILGYSPLFKEVFISTSHPDIQTIVYNEYTNSFTSFYTFSADMFIRNGQVLYSSKYGATKTIFNGYPINNPNNYFYKHDVGVYGQYYDNSLDVSSIKLLVNPNGNLVNVYDNIDFISEVYGYYAEVPTEGYIDIPAGKTVLKGNNIYRNDNNFPMFIYGTIDLNDESLHFTLVNDNIYDESFSTIRISNDYQDTGVISLINNSNLKRRFRTWRLAISRDKVSKERIKDFYTFVELIYQNEKNKRFVLHDILTYYRQNNF